MAQQRGLDYPRSEQAMSVLVDGEARAERRNAIAHIGFVTLVSFIAFDNYATTGN